MTVLLFVLIAIAGGLGAACRLLVDGLIRRRWSGAYPLGTTVINVSGSLLIGLVTGLVIAGSLPVELQLIGTTGFLGGYTTFSTASFETVRLLQEGRSVAALLNSFGMLVASVLAAGLGLWIGSLT